MRKTIMVALIMICSIVIIISFFRPWVKAVTSTTKVATGLGQAVEKQFPGTSFADKFMKNIGKATDAINKVGDTQFKTVVSGYEIPVFINRDESKTAISFIQIFSPEVKDPGNKVILIYLIPILALGCIALAVLGLKNDIYIILIACISGTISIGGISKIMNTDLSSTMAQITIGSGLWHTLYAYLFIFIISIVWFAGNVGESRAS